MSHQHEFRWFQRRRAGRRPFLVRTALVAAATAFTHTSCGGDDPSGRDAEQTTGTPGAVAPSAGQPKSGGILKGILANDVATLDPLSAKSGETSRIAAYAYNRLVKFKAGDGSIADGTIEGDLAASWEQPDPLTLLLRLRAGVTWDQRPPTNGRAATIEDVTASWERYIEVSSFAGNLANAKNKFAPITSLRALDPQTMEIKTAGPDAQLMAGLAFKFNLWVLPSEAFDGGFDPATTMRGAGPWLLERHQPSVAFSFRKNPGYYGAPQYPLVDGIEIPIIADTAQAEAQFKARHVWWGAVPATDVPAIHRDVTDTRIALDTPDAGGPTISFSWRENSPFRDKRVRQALSMLIDRDTFVEVFSDLKSFQAMGLKMRAYWSSPLGAGFGPYWLDPKESTFGPNARNYQFNVAEAKKLLEAAGYGNGLTVPLTFAAGPAYGRDWSQRAEALIAMLAKGGVTARANAVDYTAEWIPRYLRARGNFDGMAMYLNSTRADPGLWLQEFFVSTGAISQLATNFPMVDEFFIRQQREFDRQRRISIFHDVQRYFAEEVPTVPQGGGTERPSLVWNGLHGPGETFIWVGNEGAEAAETYPSFWVDAPLRG
jgi:peptide/nickel transport system substrate-binding protein